MARDARDRFDTAGEFGVAFHQSADQCATVTLHAGEIRRAATPTLKLPQWARKWKRQEIRVGLAGAMLLTMAGAIYALWPSSSTPQQGTAIAGPPAPPLVTEGATADANADAPESQPAPLPLPPSAPVRRPGHIDTNPSISLGSLHIESNAPASVLLDGHPIGAAPGVFQSVEPGERSVILDAGQGRVHEQTVVVTAGSTHHLRFDFETTPVDVTGAMARPHQSEGIVSSATSTTSRGFDRPTAHSRVDRLADGCGLRSDGRQARRPSPTVRRALYPIGTAADAGLAWQALSHRWIRERDHRSRRAAYGSRLARARHDPRQRARKLKLKRARLFAPTP